MQDEYGGCSLLEDDDEVSFSSRDWNVKLFSDSVSGVNANTFYCHHNVIFDWKIYI